VSEDAAEALHLHIACGSSCHDGYVGMDVDGSGAEIRHDPAMVPWPLDDDSVGEALCLDYVHRITPVGGSSDGLVAFMNELHRVMAAGATAEIVHPHARTDRALLDPTTARLISDQTWWNFDGQWRERERISRPTITADFEIVQIEAPLRRDWDQRADAAQAFALTHYWNVVGDLKVRLRARKV
jgi:hypothetical protein